MKAPFAVLAIAVGLSPTVKGREVRIDHEKKEAAVFRDGSATRVLADGDDVRFAGKSRIVVVNSNTLAYECKVEAEAVKSPDAAAVTAFSKGFKPYALEALKAAGARWEASAAAAAATPAEGAAPPDLNALEPGDGNALTEEERKLVDGYVEAFEELHKQIFDKLLRPTDGLRRLDDAIMGPESVQALLMDGLGELQKLAAAELNPGLAPILENAAKAFCDRNGKRFLEHAMSSCGTYDERVKLKRLSDQQKIVAAAAQLHAERPGLPAVVESAAVLGPRVELLLQKLLPFEGRRLSLRHRMLFKDLKVDARVVAEPEAKVFWAKLEEAVDEQLAQVPDLLTAANEAEQLAKTVLGASTTFECEEVPVSWAEGKKVKIQISRRAGEATRLASPRGFKLGLRFLQEAKVRLWAGLTLMFAPTATFPTYEVVSGKISQTGEKSAQALYGLTFSVSPLFSEGGDHALWVDATVNPSDSERGVALGGSFSIGVVKLGAGVVFTKHAVLDGQAPDEVVPEGTKVRTKDVYFQDPAFYIGFSIMGIPPFTTE